MSDVKFAYYETSSGYKISGKSNNDVVLAGGGTETKKSAYNKNFGNIPDTVSEGNHEHGTDKITLLSGYSSITNADDISMSDTLNSALSKLNFSAFGSKFRRAFSFNPDAESTVGVFKLYLGANTLNSIIKITVGGSYEDIAAMGCIVMSGSILSNPGLVYTSPLECIQINGGTNYAFYVEPSVQVEIGTNQLYINIHKKISVQYRPYIYIEYLSASSLVNVVPNVEFEPDATNTVTNQTNTEATVLRTALNSQLSNYSTLAGTQTFIGTNTFTQSIVVPNGTLGNHAVNLSQLNDAFNFVSTNFIPKSHPVYNVTVAQINKWNKTEPKEYVVDPTSLVASVDTESLNVTVIGYEDDIQIVNVDNIYRKQTFKMINLATSDGMEVNFPNLSKYTIDAMSKVTFYVSETFEVILMDKSATEIWV